MVVRYLQDHLATALGGGVALIVLRLVLNHKSKLVRQMDRRIDELRKERPSIYNDVRPPR